MITGTQLKEWRSERGLQAQFVADGAGLSKQQYSAIERGRRAIEVNEFIAIVKAMGYKPGDLLENSGSIREDLKPIVEELQRLHPATLARVHELLRVIDGAVIEAGRPTPKADTEETEVVKKLVQAEELMKSNHVVRMRKEPRKGSGR